MRWRRWIGVYQRGAANNKERCQAQHEYDMICRGICFSDLFISVLTLNIPNMFRDQDYVLRKTP